MVDGQRVASRKVGATFSDEQLTWAHADGRGTVEFESNGDGEVISQVAYFPSGELWFAESSGSRDIPEFRFQGKEREGTTGFYAFGKRHYEPRFGHWLSADPALPEYFTSSLAGGMANARNLGLYSYAWNNPVRFIDPDGRAVPLVVYALAAVMLPVLMGHDRPVDPDMTVTDGMIEGAVTLVSRGWGGLGKKVKQVLARAFLKRTREEGKKLFRRMWRGAAATEDSSVGAVGTARGTGETVKNAIQGLKLQSTLQAGS